MNKLKVHSFESFGTHEGPGIRFVIFVQGCNFKCQYCHNPDTQLLPSQIEKLNETTKVGAYTTEELVEKIERSRPYFGKDGGVTISGGEPLLQAKVITGLFQKLKEIGINTALDTNGSILNDQTKELLEYTDMALLDIKHVDPEWHKKVTKYECNLETVPSLTFLDYLEKIKKPVWIRYVLVPGLTDQEEHILSLCKHLEKISVVERIEILPYHTLGVEKYEKLGWRYELSDTKPPTEEEIEELQQKLSDIKKTIIIR